MLVKSLHAHELHSQQEPMTPNKLPTTPTESSKYKPLLPALKSNPTSNTSSNKSHAMLYDQETAEIPSEEVTYPEDTLSAQINLILSGQYSDEDEIVLSGQHSNEDKIGQIHDENVFFDPYILLGVTKNSFAQQQTSPHHISNITIATTTSHKWPHHSNNTQQQQLLLQHDDRTKRKEAPLKDRYDSNDEEHEDNDNCGSEDMGN